MSIIQWKYVKPLENEEIVTLYLEKENLKIPKELIECLKSNNGGRPSINAFDTNVAKERVFKSLLSFNYNDFETIHIVYNSFFREKKLFPFATDPSGNYICVVLEDNSIVYFEMESQKIEQIADSFSEFLELLY